MTSFIDIFANDSTLYSSISPSSNMATVSYNLSTGLTSIVSCGEKWRVTFNAAKTNSVTFNHHRDPSFPNLNMNSVELARSNSHNQLLGLTLTSELKWDTYISNIAKNASRMVGSLYCSKKYLSPSSIFYFYNSQIRLTMEYCCHIWAGASQRSLFYP